MRLSILVLIFFLYGCQTGYYQGPVSDHYDGLHFYNPEQPKRKSVFEIIQEVIAQQVYLPCIVSPKVRLADTYHGINHIKVTFINHSTVLLQSQDFNLLTDPVWSEKISPIFISPLRLRPPAIKFESLPRIHAVLISHNHYDHMDLPTLKKLEKKWQPLFIVPLGNKSYLQQKGIRRVIEMDWWQKIKIKNNVMVTVLPAQHWSARWLHDSNQTLWNSYGIVMANKKIYFTGDSGYGQFFKSIRRNWGQPDLAFLPIGSYTPKLLSHSVHMDPYEALKAHIDLASKKSYAIHYGAFALGCSSNAEALSAFSHAKKRYGKKANNFLVIQEGKAYIE